MEVFFSVVRVVISTAKKAFFSSRLEKCGKNFLREGFTYFTLTFVKGGENIRLWVRRDMYIPTVVCVVRM